LTALAFGSPEKFLPLRIGEPHGIIQLYRYREAKGAAVMSDRVLTIEEIRQALMPLLRKYRAERAILFGSYARNEANGKSDVDLVIIGGENFEPTDVFCIADELYRALAKNVDVYELCEINTGTDFYNTIFAEGVQIA